MVLEALAAVGLASNIVQFVQFGCEVISTTLNLDNSADKVANRHNEIQVIAKSLKEHCVALTTAQTSNQSLRDLAKHSSDVANELASTVAKINKDVTNGNSTKSRYRRFLQASKSIIKRGDIAKLQSRLESLRDQLELHLISETREHQLDTAMALEALRKSNVNQDLTYNTKFATLALKLDGIHHELSQVTACVSLKKLENPVKQFKEGFQGITDNITRATAILGSLHYESMQARHDAVRDAHKRTFEWIFSANGQSSEDSRSKTFFLPWLQHGQGIFWITGKPGSGKSTLMKYLEDHTQTIQALQEWAAPKHLAFASFYFWNAGTQMQKSLRGLLQSLLYHILRSCPKLMQSLCPSRWGAHIPSAKLSALWKVSELREAFKALKHHISSVSTKFYFHVDGLDEYEGDHYDVIQVLQELSECSDVKLCLSSRPWNCFQDTLGEVADKTSMLRLHELTAQDIELFAYENMLLHNRRLNNRRAIFDELVHEIRTRAQGVFLWVCLVVHSLREGLVNDDPIGILRRRLEGLPTDLEAFFEHILNSVDAVYQDQMARVFLAALTTKNPLSVMHYSFLDEDPEFCLATDFSNLSDEEVRWRVEQTERRLNGRYKGLLEPYKKGDILQPGDPIFFLHLTVRDFLRSPQIQKMLLDRAPAAYDAYVTIGLTLVAEIKYVKSPSLYENWTTLLVDFFEVLRDAKRPDVEYLVVDQMELITRRYAALGFTSPLVEISARLGFAVIAVHIGRIDYIKHRLAKDPKEVDMNALLFHAIQCPPFFDSEEEHSCGGMYWLESDCSYAKSAECSPLLYVVKFLLDNGADANCTVNGDTNWRLFLRRFLGSISKGPYHKKHEDTTWHDVFKLFLDHGADIGGQTDIWIEFIHNRNPLAPLGFDGACSTVFETLLQYGLKPDARVDGLSVWETLISTSVFPYTASPCETLTPGQRKLMEAFLSVTTKPEYLLTETSCHKGGVVWLRWALNSLQNDKVFEQTKIFELLLQCGVDPNRQMGCNTFWELVLESIHGGIGQDSCDHRFQAYQDLIILFLRHRADPHCAKLHKLVGWHEGVACVGAFSPGAVHSIRGILSKEMEDAPSRKGSTESSHVSATAPCLSP